jgi:hypothetical protein
MANTIIELRHSAVNGNTPSNLANGEIAINTFDGKIFYRGGISNTIQTIERYEGPSGLDGEIQFNDSGVLGASSNLTFNKVTNDFNVGGNVTATSLVSQSFIQFGDGTKQYTANAGEGGGPSVSANGFSIFSVPTQSNVVSTKPEDTIIFIGDPGLALLTDPPNNTISFSTVSVFSQANAAFAAANNAADVNLTQNTNITNATNIATGAFVQANAAFNHANSAFNKANTAGGSNQQVQFNDSGAFNGDSGFTFNKTTKALVLQGSLTVDTDTLFANSISDRVGIGTITPEYKLEVNGSFAATTKSFVIPHPTKKGKKLRYGSLEGPENGVYVRGQTTNKIIKLPSYWTKLVDPNSITVNLTPIVEYQQLYIEKIEKNKVYIKNAAGKNVNCHYIIYGERCDVEKLQVEI